MNNVMKLSKEHKDALTKALKETGNLPQSGGKVLLNITPEGKVGTVEINIVKR